MKTAEFWVEHLKLSTHPEGGFYKETYRSGEAIPQGGIPARFDGPRAFSTAIYFLLRSQDRSRFHRIKSDELWHYHAGTTLIIYQLTSDRVLQHKLGPDPERGEKLQVIIPANCWFGAKVEHPDSYTLAGCTVSPGFDFRDFELADTETLLNQFPLHRGIIAELT